MVRYENHCCDCAVPAYPCIGDSCPKVNVPVYYCDRCNNETHAKYEIEGEHYCKGHAVGFFKEVFKDLIIEEQAKVLKLSLKELEIWYERK